MTPEQEIARRRTFAIIAHPDAGKTTLTEKLLLFGGAIQMAGAVKARGDARRAKSDWMKVEQERGISVVSSVMTFEYADTIFNLLDTPGHEDFSEDTYRTLTAVDSAIMVLDAAKGIESQTLKLFEVCRLRDIPIITFVNKMDRDTLGPFDLIDDIEKRLAMDVTPATWPIGGGRDFKGTYDLAHDRLQLFERGGTDAGVMMQGLDDPRIDTLVPAHLAEQMREEVEMVRGACKPFDRQSYLEGHMTPVFFGSAVNNFGVRELLNGVRDLAPTPRAQPTRDRSIDPGEKSVSAFVFKIQANMDPKHRDRIAFARIASGVFKKGMKLKHVRTGKILTIHTPLMFFANERETAETAFPGDIVGLPNHGGLRIGDALTEGEELVFTGIPSFAPELLQRVRAIDPMKAKHLESALVQLAEEGVARVFKPKLDSGWIVGVVGALQFEILADRIRTEYNIPVKFEDVALYTARWVAADDAKKLKEFLDKNQSALADDHDGDPVFLARNAWHLGDTQDKYPDLRFTAVK
ncbi:MAG: peptide chain release factor 3 [Rhodospirillales bacterium]|nr:peptide chain release factor 3 [Rhodospirillales bacterium]USO07537.1 MAG: peptide chain release factor 3 [Rhodospirillales bacterium]